MPRVVPPGEELTICPMSLAPRHRKFLEDLQAAGNMRSTSAALRLVLDKLIDNPKQTKAFKPDVVVDDRKTHSHHIRLPGHLSKFLDATAEHFGQSQSGIIADLVQAYMDSFKEQPGT